MQNISGEFSNPWRYECVRIADIDKEHYLLIRIVVAKVLNEVELEKLLKAVPVYQRDDADRAKAEAFDCVAWVREAIAALRSSDSVAALESFEDIDRRAVQYVQRKKDQGRWAENIQTGVPVLDLLQDKEMLE